VAPSASTRTADRRLYITTAALFLAASALTAYYVDTMRGGMPMPGGWTMSMMWMRMPGQSRLVAAGMFATMWIAMMVAMMLPSSLPMLLLYRRAAAFASPDMLAMKTWALGVGYFAVWLGFGLAAYVLGTVVSDLTMRSERASLAVPVLSGAAIVAAGVYQLTSWKTACLRHCRDPLHIVARHLNGGVSGALALGVHHGALCTACCWALMVIQLSVGIMSLTAMVAVATVIALEKLLPHGEIIARIIGGGAIVAGVWMVARAVS
jgi:predicted metal-binding membrane protein